MDSVDLVHTYFETHKVEPVLKRGIHLETEILYLINEDCKIPPYPYLQE